MIYFFSDIKVKEPTPESMTKKVKEYLPPQFMSVSTASRQLLDIIRAKPEDEEIAVNGETLAVGVARVGSETQEIISCPLADMASVDLGPPLHSLVIVGNLHPLEEEYLAYLALP